MRQGTALALTLFALGCSAPVELEPASTEPEPAEAESPLVEPGDGALDELLASSLLPHGLHFVVAGPQAHLVLGARGAALAPSGPLELLQAPDESAVSLTTFRSFAEGELDESLTELASATRGARFVLYGAKGALCTVVAGEVGVLRRADFDAAWVWREDPPAPGTEALRAWELGAGSPLLTAETTPADGDCSGARYALSEAARPPRIWAEQPRIGDALATAAISELRARPEWLAIQEELRASGGRGRWDELDGAKPVATLWRDASSGSELVLVSANAGAGCGEFGGSLWGLFARSQKGFVALRVSTGWDLPDHVLDADGDGRPELFSGDALVFEEDGEPRTVDIQVPSAHCPC